MSVFWPRFSRLHTTQRSRWRGRVFACWLVLLAVLAPTLAQIHGVLHTPQARWLAAPQGAVSNDGAFVPAQATAGAHRSVAAWFAHHAVLDCWELEQLGHGHDLPTFVWQGASPCPVATVQWHPHTVAASAPARRFQARAPPAQSVV